MHKDIYQQVTQRMIDLLEQGNCPWRKPWSSHSIPPQNFASKRPYSGINFFMLGATEFDSPYFMTFRQVKQHGGQVIKGSKGFPVTYWDSIEVEPNPKDRRDEPKVIPFLKAYTVFNSEQIKGIGFPELPEVNIEPVERIERADQIINAWYDSPEVKHGGNRACYVVDQDMIRMPDPTHFSSSEHYYATRFHEMGHATGAKSRLNRKFGKSFGNRDYSREELVAEMTSAFLCAQCGIDNDVIENQASYIKGWMRELRNDPKMVVWASGQAQKASRLILGAQPELNTPTIEQRHRNKQYADSLAREIAEERRVRYQPRGIETNHI